MSGWYRSPILALALVVALGTSARAATIYNNGAPDGSNGNEMTQWIQAEDFVLAGDALLTDITFWAFSFEDPGGYTGNITWRIYADDGLGDPDETNILASGNVVPTRTFDHVSAFGNSYQYDFSISPLLLSGGTTYWLGLHNGPLGTDDRLEFYWETTLANLTLRGHEDVTPFDAGGWLDNGLEHAFVLQGREVAAVPEPATLLLLGGGLAAAAMRRRRQSNVRG
jgi:hypothetical protein